MDLKFVVQFYVSYYNYVLQNHKIINMTVTKDNRDNGKFLVCLIKVGHNKPYLHNKDCKCGKIFLIQQMSTTGTRVTILDQTANSR